MTQTARALVRNDRGVTTAEYAVCTGAGVGLAGLLWKLLTSDFGQQLLKQIFEAVLRLLPF
jgi:Flp pilus assembly pilin Flp